MKNKLPFLILPALLALTACGVKPGTLTPPEGASAPSFPQSYPKGS